MGSDRASDEPSARASRWVRIGLVLGALGVAAWALRWLLQGGAGVWTDSARSFWVPDPTLGWVESERSWVWLGLDGLWITATIVFGTWVVQALAARLAGRARLARVLRGLAVVGAGVAMLTPVLPAW